MNTIHNLLLIGIIGLCMISCGSSRLSNYYYPLNGNKSQVYVYVNTESNQPNEYWQITPNKTKKTLSVESYDANFRLFNVSQERRQNRGFKLIEYIEYEYQETYADREIEAEILSAEVFDFNKKKNYQYTVEYANSKGKFQFSKERYFIGFETVLVQDQEYKAAKFSDKYNITEVDTKDAYEFEQTTYYGKGIGLIKYVRSFPNKKKRVLELLKIESEEEFLNMINDFHNKDYISEED